jgi:hypothetical protein
MQVASNEQDGPLFPTRFSLRGLLFVTAAACVALVLCRFFAISESLLLLEVGSLLFGTCVIAWAGWAMGRANPRYLGLLLMANVASGSCLLIGPIAAYHINGRAWYDYGLSAWNPPVSSYSDGRTGVGDYDPKWTPPAIWPVIGPAFYTMCIAGIGLMILPPTAPALVVLSALMAMRFRRVLTASQKHLVCSLWVVGSLPTLYLLVWGLKVLEWIAD